MTEKSIKALKREIKRLKEQKSLLHKQNERWWTTGEHLDSLKDNTTLAMGQRSYIGQYVDISCQITFLELYTNDDGSVRVRRTFSPQSIGLRNLK